MEKIVAIIVGVLVGLNIFTFIHYQNKVRDLSYAVYASEMYGARQYYGRNCDISKSDAEICRAAESINSNDWRNFYDAHRNELSYGIFNKVWMKR